MQKKEIRLSFLGLRHLKRTRLADGRTRCGRKVESAKHYTLDITEIHTGFGFGNLDSFGLQSDAGNLSNFAVHPPKQFFVQEIPKHIYKVARWIETKTV